MELTFVNQYGDSTPKRRRLAKACESCRARKVGTVDAPLHRQYGPLSLLTEALHTFC